MNLISKEVFIKTDKTGLSGEEFGIELYTENKKEIMQFFFEENTRINLVFPSCVGAVSISFIKGFFKEISKYTSNYQEFRFKFKIMGDSHVKEKIYRLTPEIFVDYREGERVKMYLNYKEANKIIKDRLKDNEERNFITKHILNEHLWNVIKRYVVGNMINWVFFYYLFGQNKIK